MKVKTNTYKTYICEICGGEYKTETLCRMCEDLHKYRKVHLFLMLSDLSWNLNTNSEYIYVDEPKNEVRMSMDTEMIVDDGLAINWSIITEDAGKGVQMVKEAALAWLEMRKQDLLKEVEIKMRTGDNQEKEK